MKMTLLFLFCVLCTAGAFAQSAVTSSAMVDTYSLPDHAQQAAPHAMAQERSLLTGSSSVLIAHGERPLWEVAPVVHEIPLGDLARIQRKEHAAAKKANVTLEK